MAEYIPPLQLPQGLAEQVGRMAQERSQIIPNAINGAMGNMFQAFMAKEQLKRQYMSAPQVASLTDTPKMPGMPYGTPVPQGYQGAQYQPNPSDIFPNGYSPAAQSFLMEKERTKQMMAGIQARGAQQVQNFKDEAPIRAGAAKALADEKNTTPLSDSIKQLYLDAGYPEPEGPRVPNTELSAMRQLAVQNNKPATQPTVTDEQKASLEWGMRNSLIAPAQMTYRGPKLQILAEALGEMRSGKRPQQSLMDLDAALSGKKSGASAAATFQESGLPQKLGRAAQSAENTLHLVQLASDAFPRADVQMLNKPLISFGKQYSPEGQDWQTTITGAQLELARVFASGNDPNELQTKLAQKYFPDDVTPAQLPQVIQTVAGLMDAIKSGVMTPISSQGAKPSKTAAPGSAPGSSSLDDVFKKHGVQ